MLCSGRRVMAQSLPDLSGLTILVIEDHADSRETLTTGLTACGARVLPATSAEQARTYTRTARFDVIVTDLALPGESGAAFVSWLRMQPHDRGGDTAAVAITGFPKDFPAMRIGGFAAYFQKPIDLENVCATISALVKRQGR
jgi:CheY-like chemotaxis protein